MANGFNVTMEGSPYQQTLNAIQAKGLKAMVWLGAWHNSTCSWEDDDNQIRSWLTAIAGHPAILGYYLGDEPQFGMCPNAPAAYKARTALVHSLDPGRPTFTVIASYDSILKEDYPYEHWVGTVDILGLDIYPCSFQNGCNFSSIDAAIAAAARDNITRYWAILQDFQDSWYQLPTPAAIQAQFDHWAASKMSGYSIFSWSYGSVNLDSYPTNTAMLKYENSLHGGPN